MSFGGSRALEAAQRAAVLLNDLIDRSPKGRFLYVAQMRDSVGGVPANIAEGLGRRRGADRNYKFEVARGEAEETLKRLYTNFATHRIAARDYWRIRDLLVTVVKMLNALIHHG